MTSSAAPILIRNRWVPIQIEEGGIAERIFFRSFLQSCNSAISLDNDGSLHRGVELPIVIVIAARSCGVEIHRLLALAGREEPDAGDFWAVGVRRVGIALHVMRNR